MRIEKVGVVGCGLMGSGIAQTAAEGGYATVVRGAKLALFAELDRVCKPSAIFATNTSSFRVAEVAAATKRPTLVGGLHYFFPPVINKLLEVIRTQETAP